jgi:hypothetical protein
MPDYSLAGYEFCDLKCAAMNILEVVIENGVKSIGVTLDFFRPPSTNIADGSDNFFRSLVDLDGRRVIIVVHTDL